MIFSQRNHVVVGLAAVANAFAGTVYSDVFSMKNYNHITFLLHKAVGTTGTTAVTVQACDDTTPSNRSAIAFRYKTVADTSTSDVPGVLTDATTSGFTTTAGSNELYLIEVDAAALPDGYPFVQVKCVESAADPVLGGIIAILSEPRFTDDVTISVIA